MNIIVETKATLQSLSKNNLAISRVYGEDEQVNVDWIVYKELKYSSKNLRSLRKQAKSISKQKNIYEVHLVAQGADDPVVQEFYANGKLSFKAF